MRKLATGATGYIGSRLVPTLIDAEHEVVAAMRNPDEKSSVAWGGRVDTARVDLDDHDTFDTATVPRRGSIHRRQWIRTRRGPGE